MGNEQMDIAGIAKQAIEEHMRKGMPDFIKKTVQEQIKNAGTLQPSSGRDIQEVAKEVFAQRQLMQQLQFVPQQVRELTKQLNSLLSIISVSEGEIRIEVGASSLTMKKDGTITIKGKDIEISGSGRLRIKADGTITLKGSKITEN
ncbi:MAG: hypothetical protein ABI539_13185 [Acidobacteriota bacterium]